MYVNSLWCYCIYFNIWRKDHMNVDFLKIKCYIFSFIQTHFFNCCLVFYYMNMPKHIHFTIDKHSNCFWFLTITNCFAKNILCMSFPTQGQGFLSVLPRNVMVRSDGMCTFTIARYFQILIQSTCTSLYFYREWENDFLHSCQQLVVSYFFNLLRNFIYILKCAFPW